MGTISKENIIAFGTVLDVVCVRVRVTMRVTMRACVCVGVSVRACRWRR